MLKVNVVDADKNPEPVRAGQVRTDGDGTYVLVVINEDGKFNAIKLLGDSRFIIEDFETLFNYFVTDREIEQNYPIVIDAELTIKGA
ncbi:MAG: hypothetical protein IRZ03_10670 [Acidobacterium ailaaui]|nr:hypothetical protein [Pseudacidobacterium ailaaui]